MSLAGDSSTIYGSKNWYQLYEGGYVAANDVLLYSPSVFQGIEVSARTDIPIAWVLADTAVSTSAGTPPLAGAPRVVRYERVTILERKSVDGVDWYRIGRVSGSLSFESG